jgi:hypothetical protein
MVATTANATEDWQHKVGLYGWLAGLEGTIGIGNVAEQDVEANFSDLLNYVDFALAGHYEARGPKTVYLVDVSYTGLGSERDAEVLHQPVKIKMDLDQWIVELGGGFRVSPKFDVLLAGRYYDISTGATFSSENDEDSGSVSDGWFDIFLGGRYHTNFGTKWEAAIRGDIGVGGSDFAWFGQVQLGYLFSEHWGAIAAWRILSLDYSGDDGASYLRYDVSQSGLGLGAGYKF